MVMSLLALSDLISAWLIHSLGPVHPFCLASWLLAHQGEGLAEVEASGSTSVCHSFWKADTSNELVPDKVSAFARSLVTSQHL